MVTYGNLFIWRDYDLYDILGWLYVQGLQWKLVLG